MHHGNKEECAAATRRLTPAPICCIRDTYMLFQDFRTSDVFAVRGPNNEHFSKRRSQGTMTHYVASPVEHRATAHTSTHDLIFTSAV